MLKPGVHPRTRRAVRAAMQRGLSMVELMVGVAVGLLVVAAAAMMAATQLSDNRRMLLEVQVQQDLRAAMDTMSREVRRAGARTTSPDFVWWTPDLKGFMTVYGLERATPTAGTSAQIGYIYERAIFDPGFSGFKLTAGALQMLSPSVSQWSDLTDVRALTANQFVVTAEHQGDPDPTLPAAPQRIPCPKLCPTTNDTSCWPFLRVRRFEIDVDAQAVSDAAVKRHMRTIVHPRNNELVVSPGLPYMAVCPS